MKEIKIGMVSLGCSKNRVDSELMLGALKKKNYVFTADPAQADAIIINTCGFIQSAKQESIDTILEMAEFKKTGNLKALIVCGCLSGRYQKELSRQLPEVDAFLGVTAYDKIAQAVEQALQGLHFESYDAPKVEGDYKSRVLTTPGHYAYLKIAEGCNNRCAYCAIPYIRGGLKSRPIEEILQEAEVLLQKGVRELILVAQDTSKYGVDLAGKSMLCQLIDALAPLPGLKWLRLLYCYPDGITDELLDTMSKYGNIARYLDIPIQHLADPVLRRMNRKNTHRSTYEAVERIRKRYPDFILRTTLIAGFPGETQEDFEILKRGVEELQFDRLGVFAYSREDGTPAARLPGQIPEQVKQARARELMLLQQGISLRANQKRIGQRLEVLVEEYLPEEKVYLARSYGEAPEIDGGIILRSEQPLECGSFYTAAIEDANEYELIGGIAK